MWTVNQGQERKFFGRFRFAFGLYGSIRASLLREMGANSPAKGVVANRFYPKSRVHNLNQQLIWERQPLIYIENWLLLEPGERNLTTDKHR
jgi:hypothetical protein